ncbi:MAG: hypothetical protein Q7S02_03680, partial [bacterium]|nr:hypothetical protein [bacterium]
MVGKERVAHSDPENANATLGDKVDPKTRRAAERAAKSQAGASQRDIAELEARITPIEEILGNLVALAEQDRKEIELIAKMRVRMQQHVREIDQLEVAAREHGLDARRGARTEAKGELQEQIDQREELIKKLFVYPLAEDHPKAEQLLAACVLARKIHRRRAEGADFGAVRHFLATGVKLEFYRVLDHDAFEKLRANPESTDVARRAIHYNKQAYLLEGKRRGIWLLHTEMVELVNDARHSADAERALEEKILKHPLPEDFKSLLLSGKPPATPVTFGIVVETLLREGEEPIMFGRKLRDGSRKPTYGCLQIEVGADQKDPQKNRLTVTAATRTARKALPFAFEKDGSVSALVIRDVVKQRLDTAAWCRDLLGYIVAVGREGFQQFRK